jgi:hypothetical protein
MEEEERAGELRKLADEAARPNRRSPLRQIGATLRHPPAEAERVRPLEALARAQGSEIDRFRRLLAGVVSRRRRARWPELRQLDFWGTSREENGNEQSG